MEIEFYWNRNYVFDPAKKYLIYYRGCFCPPTRGHVSLISGFAQPHLNANVTIFISQMGSSRRHGVPYKVNRDIWKRYIEHCFPKESRIILAPMTGAQDILPHLTGVDRVIYLLGNEKENLMSDKSTTKLQRRQKKQEKKTLHQRDHLIRLLRERHTVSGLDFLFVDRPEKKTLSATQFVTGVEKDVSMEKLAHFMPENLPRQQQKEIISMLKKTF